MSLSIQTNVTAMQTVYDMQTNDATESSAIEKLSSGYQINTAADDPAGLATSQNLEAQVEGLGQATNNANDAINLIKTAGGALTQVQSLLLDIRDKAIDAANVGANDVDAAQDDQTQIQQDIAALSRISSQTTFGDKELLNGSNSLTATITDSTDISGVGLSATDSALQAGNADLVVTQAATQATITGSDSGLVGTATVANAGTITINGQNVQVGASDTYNQVVSNINALSATTGVTASISTGSLVLTQNSYGSANAISYSETADIFNGGTTATAAGLNAQGTITQGSTVTDFNSGNGNILQDAAGDTITLATGTTAGTYNNAFAVAGTPLTFQIGADAGQTVSFSMTSTAPATEAAPAPAMYRE